MQQQPKKGKIKARELNNNYVRANMYILVCHLINKVPVFNTEDLNPSIMYKYMRLVDKRLQYSNDGVFWVV